MKKVILKLADSLMSKEQMKSIKGGTMYCMCDGVLHAFGSGSGYTCEYFCAGGGHCGCCATGCPG